MTDEAYAAAWCRHRHGDPVMSDDEKAAHKALSDLVKRTKTADRIPRDERRLAQHYQRTIDAAKAADIERYRACPKCSGPSAA